jgi:hypothetical protein
MRFQQPPTSILKEDISPWIDALEETVPLKIKSCMSKIQKLEEEYKKDMETISENNKSGKYKDKFSLWFVIMLVTSRYSFVVKYQKWLRYWLSLYEKLPSACPIKELPNSFYDRERALEIIKQKPIEDYYDGNLRTSGSRLCGRCPFHEEKNSSFFIFTNTNTFHCFGCQAHGDVITFIEKTKNLDFKGALEFLK